MPHCGWGTLKYQVALIIAAIAFLNFLVQLRKCENKKGFKEDLEQGGRDEDLELLQTLRIRDEDNGNEQSEESKKVKTTTLLFFSVFLSPITIPSMALYYTIASIRISMDKEKARTFATEKRKVFMELSKRLVNS